MDHAEARELLDLAAVEPGGLDRLVAGDTLAATALAGHLAGCEECTEEFTRLRRASPILREVIASQPPAELKERTLAFVAAVGRPRGEALGGSSSGDWRRRAWHRGSVPGRASGRGGGRRRRIEAPAGSRLATGAARPASDGPGWR